MLRHWIRFFPFLKTGFENQEEKFESNSDNGLDAVICVTCPINLRIDRIKSRDGFSYFEIKNRIQNQISQEEKANLSDFVIINDEKDLLLTQIIKIHEKLIN